MTGKRFIISLQTYTINSFISSSFKIMPLIIEDKCFTTSSDTSCIQPGRIFESFGQLKRNSELFIDQVQSETVLKSLDIDSDRVLYVLQQEFATISPCKNSSNIKYIGSADATTCHIVIMKYSASGAISLAHLDGAQTFEALQKMLIEIHDISRYKFDVAGQKGNVAIAGEEQLNSPFDIDLFIFGGFVDDKNYSEKLFGEILMSCVKCNDNLNLKLAPCYTLNTTLVNTVKKPIIYGVVVEVVSGEISAALFKNKGPDLHLRHVKIGSDLGVCSCYDFHKEHVQIPPFTYHPPYYIDQLLSLPDHVYLQYTSTSPQCEPDDFVETSKGTFRFMLENPDRKVFENGVRSYVLTSNGVWTLV